MPAKIGGKRKAPGDASTASNKRQKGGEEDEEKNEAGAADIVVDVTGERGADQNSGAGADGNDNDNENDSKKLPREVVEYVVVHVDRFDQAHGENDGGKAALRLQHLDTAAPMLEGVGWSALSGQYEQPVGSLLVFENLGPLTKKKKVPRLHEHELEKVQQLGRETNCAHCREVIEETEDSFECMRCRRVPSYRLCTPCVTEHGTGAKLVGVSEKQLAFRHSQLFQLNDM